MVEHLKGVIHEFPKAITGTATSPVADHLFDVRYDQERFPLEEGRAITFHHSMAHLIFACTRSRKDIQTAMAFLTTRVRSLDEDDWEKLKRVLKYICGMIYMPLNKSST
jgi:hypothetical protein